MVLQWVFTGEQAWGPQPYPHMAPHPARSAACPELCTAHLLSPGFAGYPSAQLPAITHSSNKCHQAFPTQVKLFLGGVARSEEGERRTPACWHCDSPAAPEMAFPARHHCPSPATLLCHSQTKHRVLPISPSVI